VVITRGVSEFDLTVAETATDAPADAVAAASKAIRARGARGPDDTGTVPHIGTAPLGEGKTNAGTLGDGSPGRGARVGVSSELPWEVTLALLV
jgi:hypothetical protein